MRYSWSRSALKDYRTCPSFSRKKFLEQLRGGLIARYARRFSRTRILRVPLVRAIRIGRIQSDGNSERVKLRTYVLLTPPPKKKKKHTRPSGFCCNVCYNYFDQRSQSCVSVVRNRFTAILV